jgi:hypothetical protein
LFPIGRLKKIFSETAWPNEPPTPSDGKSSLCLWQDELKKNGRMCPQDTDAPCFLPKLSKPGHNSRTDKVVKSGKKTWSSIYDP